MDGLLQVGRGWLGYECVEERKGSSLYFAVVAVFFCFVVAQQCGASLAVNIRSMLVRACV